MKKYKVIKTYLIDLGRGWKNRAPSDEIEEFEAETEKDALNYFIKIYGPTVNIRTDNFYIKNGLTVNTYNLEKVQDNEDIVIIAYAIAD